MSLKKKDPSMRVAANDPHLVSLGGGRLSTAVTIHYIPIGDTSIGSSPLCSISLNGSGVHLFHCTIYRSEQNEVTIVPENDGRILIDGNKITYETNLTQGAMITIGNSNYLRFNNPAEAQLMRSAMGSNERISMPQIDFTQEQNNSNRNSGNNDYAKLNSIETFYEKNITPNFNLGNSYGGKSKIENICLNNVHSPKVFTADSITVNTPAKDVLGPKYASFTKNFIENHKNEKNVNGFLNNESRDDESSIYGRVSTNSAKTARSTSCEMLTKVNNVAVRNQQLATAYDRYPKPGTYGGLQLFPMNGVNNEINVSQSGLEKTAISNDNQKQNQANTSNISYKDDERLEELLKICTEYERQNQSMTSSPIVQNRIKTNGSLPREKKSPFYDLSPQSTTHNNKIFFPEKNKSNSSGYENVRIVGERRIEIGGFGSPKNSSGYENVIVGKYVPNSPRTKIRTTCMSPKKDPFIVHQPIKHPNNKQSKEYAQLIQSFEDKMRMEMLDVNNSAKTKIDETKQTRKKNINNLTLNLRKNSDLLKSKEHLDNGETEKIIKTRSEILDSIRNIKSQISEMQCQEMEVQREMDMEKSLVSAEYSSISKSIEEMENRISTLKSKIHRMEAQRNANRVMQENQQSKLRQSIDVKQDQKDKLATIVRQNFANKSLKEELENCEESLENDIKTFEDLEFQYLEEETDWLGYRDELLNELQILEANVEEKRLQLKHLEAQGIENQNIACNDTKKLENHLHSLFASLENNREKLLKVDEYLKKKNCNLSDSGHSDEEDKTNNKCHQITTMMSQSLFGSAEILCSKRPTEDQMSKSINENMFYNNNIESSMHATSTPKKSMQIIDIVDYDLKRSETQSKDYDITPEVVRRKNNAENDPLLKLKYNVEYQERVNFNLSLGSDDFEVNPLDKRIPSQDDIDRICKVTTEAPISTKGASSKIFDSIMEIERNRQLLLAQQGSHVIEHERQKILELKKKSHDEARAEYLSQLSDCCEQDNSGQYIRSSSVPENYQLPNKEQNIAIEHKQNSPHRFSQPDLESQRTRPLSEANSDMTNDILSQNVSKSNLDLTPKSISTAVDDKSNANSNRSSLNSGETTNTESKSQGNKRSLPKHQRPLTRYLPIFSPDLDLKLHIESAGHQIQICPHVHVDGTSCRGYLHKLGATFHGWSRRWFVLDRKTSAFIYYSDKSEKKPRGGAYFSTINEVYLDHLNASKSGRPHCTFIVKTKKRSYHLQAASDAAARIWIDAIITGAQGNLDY